MLIYTYKKGKIFSFRKFLQLATKTQELVSPRRAHVVVAFSIPPQNTTNVSSAGRDRHGLYPVIYPFLRDHKRSTPSSRSVLRRQSDFLHIAVHRLMQLQLAINSDTYYRPTLSRNVPLCHSNSLIQQTISQSTFKWLQQITDNWMF